MYAQLCCISVPNVTQAAGTVLSLWTPNCKPQTAIAFNKSATLSKAEYFSTAQQHKARVVPSSHFDTTRIVVTDYRELKL
jgi:hypothetical protein